jgi:hypothetical protein
MTTTNDKLLQKQARRQFFRFYVPVTTGYNELFTSYSRARKFAKHIGAEVKPLD